MKVMTTIFFAILSMTASVLTAAEVTEIEEQLSAQPGLHMLMDNFSSEVGAQCRFSHQSSYFYDFTETARSFIGVYRCGEGPSYPFVRVAGSILEDGELSLFKIVFIK